MRVRTNARACWRVTRNNSRAHRNARWQQRSATAACALARKCNNEISNLINMALDCDLLFYSWTR